MIVYLRPFMGGFLLNNAHRILIGRFNDVSSFFVQLHTVCRTNLTMTAVGLL